MDRNHRKYESWGYSIRQHTTWSPLEEDWWFSGAACRPHHLGMFTYVHILNMIDFVGSLASWLYSYCWPIHIWWNPPIYIHLQMCLPTVRWEVCAQVFLSNLLTPCTQSSAPPACFLRLDAGHGWNLPLGGHPTWVFKGRDNDDKKKTYKELLEIMKRHIARVREDRNIAARDKVATDYTNLGKPTTPAPKPAAPTPALKDGTVYYIFICYMMCCSIHILNSLLFWCPSLTP